MTQRPLTDQELLIHTARLVLREHRMRDGWYQDCRACGKSCKAWGGICNSCASRLLAIVDKE